MPSNGLLYDGCGYIAVSSRASIQSQNPKSHTWTQSVIFGRTPVVTYLLKYRASEYHTRRVLYCTHITELYYYRPDHPSPPSFSFPVYCTVRVPQWLNFYVQFTQNAVCFYSTTVLHGQYHTSRRHEVFRQIFCFLAVVGKDPFTLRDL